MELKPETPTITIDMIAVVEAINKIMVRGEGPDYVRVGLEQLAVLQLFMVQAAGHMIEDAWTGDEPMKIHDISATLTTMAIVIREAQDRIDPDELYGTLVEAIGALSMAASETMEHFKMNKQGGNSGSTS